MKKILCILLCLLVLLQLGGCIIEEQIQKPAIQQEETIPPFSGEPYVVVNNNVPDFSEDELDTDA